MTLRVCLLLLTAAVLPACGDEDSGPSEISFPGVGAKGVFDPSLERDPGSGRLWMAYSEVLDSPMWPGRNDWIRTRLAWSDDAGGTWTDAGLVVNPAEDLVLPLAPPLEAGTWNQEVPALVRDPGAPPAERWKLFWHRYLWINGARHFEHGWVAMKTAPAPAGPWSAERKLFTGTMYEAADDAIIGPPERPLDTLHADLAACWTPSEPGLLATADALYVAMLSAEGPSTSGRIVLLRWLHASPGWTYQGSFLVNAADGPATGVHGFSAPELYLDGTTPHLIVTPQVSDLYLGTRVYRITDLDGAAIERVGGVPSAMLSFSGTAGSHNGAAGFEPEATACGILYSEAAFTLPIRFRIVRSRRVP